MRAVHGPQSIVHRRNSPTSYELRATSCILAALFLACLILPLSAQAATYYVSLGGNDNNQGTEAAPFKTIYKGIDVAKTGDTIIVMAGNDNWQKQPFEISKNRVGSSSKLTDYDYLRKGIVDVTLFGADPTGRTDSTVAIQNAVYVAREYRMATFFPNQSNGERGVYLVSDSIKCMKYPDDGQPNVLLGSNKGKVRPIIKLQSNVSKFSDPSNPVPLVWFWAVPWHLDTDPMKIAGKTDPKYDRSDTSFNQVFKGIDIDLGGNSGAIGIKNCGAQGAAVEDTKINAIGALAGLGRFGVLGCANYNVDVDGGQYAVYGSANGEILNGYNGHGIMIGCTFRNQEKAVLFLANTVMPIILAGCHIVEQNGILNGGRGFLTLDNIDEKKGLYYNNVDMGHGGISLVDCIIEVDGGQIFNDHNNFHMRNVYVKGADSVANGWNISDKTNWTRVKEYVYIRAYGQNMIDGNVNANEIKEKVEGLNIPLDQLINSLVKKHQWDESTFPSFEDADAVDVKDLGDKGDGQSDDADALQAAIDQHQKIFLSKGVYKISRTLELKSNTQMFGIWPTISSITTVSSWQPSGEAIILTTVDDKNAKTLLAFISVNSDPYEIPGQGGFTPVEWRAGRNSMTRNLTSSIVVDFTREAYHNFHRVRINKGGGGRHFALLGGQSDKTAETCRGLLIENTTEPLSIYAFNDATEPRIVTDIKNSKNINLYGLYSEEATTEISIDKSENIYVFTGNKNNPQNNGRGGIEIFDSNNIMASNYAFTGCEVNPNLNAYSLKEIYSGTQTVIDNNKANVALYKRGAFLDILYGDVSGDGIVSAYDAALTAQAAVGLVTLTAEQIQAADVSGEGNVTAYDAALIAQKAVGLIDKFPVEE